MKAISMVLVLVVVGACGDDDPVMPDAAPDAAAADASSVDAPANACPTAEIKFTQATGCANDGGVEFCIPDNDAQLVARLQAIEPAISCATGGGRAMCNTPAGRLLCSYRTAFPQQCETVHGAMTADTWGDMCAIAAMPEVTEIVPTILE